MSDAPPAEDDTSLEINAATNPDTAVEDIVEAAAEELEGKEEDAVDETMKKEDDEAEADPAVEAPSPEEPQDATVTETDANAAEGEKPEGEGNVEESTEAVVGKETTTPKETKKRVRRVGKTPTRKMAKIVKNEESAIPMDVVDAHVPPADGTVVAAADAAVTATAGEGVSDGIKSTDEPADAENNDTTIGGLESAAATTTTTPNLQAKLLTPTDHQKVLSKHDEKWNGMFVKLLEFKEKNKNTLVPQCYNQDARLGRWVHYQRVEYWIFQQTGTAKITEERIGRLDAIDFEWDPQKAQWEKMFEKLKEYKAVENHCRVPKGYDKDWELANWVRNQRLEQANLTKPGKKSRMTPERYKLLDDMGFKWSVATPARANRNSGRKKSGKVGEEQKENGTPINSEEVTADGKPAGESTMVEGQVPTETFVDSLNAVANEAVAATDETIAEDTVPEENPDEKVSINDAEMAEHVEV